MDTTREASCSEALDEEVARTEAEINRLQEQRKALGLNVKHKDARLRITKRLCELEKRLIELEEMSGSEECEEEGSRPECIDDDEGSCEDSDGDENAAESSEDLSLIHI